MALSSHPLKTFEATEAFSDDFRSVVGTSSIRSLTPRSRSTEIELCAGGAGVRLTQLAAPAPSHREWIRLFHGVYFVCFRGNGSAPPLEYQGSHVQEDMLNIIHLSEGRYYLNLANDQHLIKSGDWLLYSRHPGTDIFGSTEPNQPYFLFGYLFFGDGLRNALRHFSIDSPALIERCRRTPESSALHLARSFKNLQTDLCGLALVKPTEDSVDRAELIRHKIGELFMLIDQTDIQHVENLANPLTVQELRAIEQARELIGANLKAPPTLSELTELTGLNRTKLALGFRIICRKTMREYRSMKRLELARDLLVRSDLPLTEIAHQTGYSTQANFTRAYSGYFGVSPLKARKQFRLQRALKTMPSNPRFRKE